MRESKKCKWESRLTYVIIIKDMFFYLGKKYRICVNFFRGVIIDTNDKYVHVTHIIFDVVNNLGKVSLSVKKSDKAIILDEPEITILSNSRASLKKSELWV